MHINRIKTILPDCSGRWEVIWVGGEDTGWSPHLSERRWPQWSSPVDPHIWSLPHWSATLSQFSNAFFGVRFRVGPLCHLPAPGPIVISYIGECDQLFCYNNHLWPKWSLCFIHWSFSFMTLYTVSVLYIIKRNVPCLIFSVFILILTDPPVFHLWFYILYILLLLVWFYFSVYDITEQWPEERRSQYKCDRYK